MVADITTAISGILSAIGDLLSPTSGSTQVTAVAWVTLLALPVAGGAVALGKRLVKKAR